MDQDVSENILSLTLEIIYLLTGENYGPIKKKSDGPPPFLLSSERNIDKKIIVVTQKIIDLLTGEVPIRCQDVTVYFSMEEWEYLEGHKDLYKEAMMEKRPPLTSAANAPSPDCPSEDPIIVTNSPTDQSSSAEEQNITCSMEKITKDLNSSREDEEGFLECDISTTTPHMVTTIVKEELLPSEEAFLHPVDSTDSIDDYKMETFLVEEHLLQPDTPTVTQPTQYPSAHYEEDSFPCEEPCTQTEFSLSEHSTTVHDQVEYASIFYSSCYLNQSKDPQEPCGFINAFTCFECNKCFRDRSELVAHQRSHSVQKPYCITSSAGLASPQVLHPSKTSFSCSDCGKFFSTYSNLSLHRKIHLGVKPYSCPECGKCFLRNSHLTRHRQSHVGNRVKPFTCTECGKSFLSRSSFVVHWRSHTGENPYSCSECGKSFPAYSCLVQHWRVHTGEKPYPCTECGKSFAAYSNLTLHHRIHTGEKPYCCSDCGKRFVRNSHLRRHRKCHMGEESHLYAQ